VRRHTKPDHANIRVFRYIEEHGPITEKMIVRALGLRTEQVAAILETLRGADLISLAGHDPDGTPMYAALQA